MQIPPSFTRDARGPQRLALGTWRMHKSGQLHHPDSVCKLISKALELDITWIDTAEIYGGYETESLLGLALKADPHLKKSVKWITKCGIYAPSSTGAPVKIPHYNASREQIIHSAEKSLHLLDVERLDILLIHRPDWFTRYEETADALQTLLVQGKIHYAGVSNFTAPQWRALQSCLPTPLLTNQVEFSLTHDAPMLDGTFDLCQEFRSIPMAWSALGGGKIFASDPLRPDLIRKLEKIALDHDTKPDVIAMAWVLAHPSHPMLITGTSRPDRLELAVEATKINLHPEEKYALWCAATGRSIP